MKISVGKYLPILKSIIRFNFSKNPYKILHVFFKNHNNKNHNWWIRNWKITIANGY
jgi:hypothetical protein